MYTWFINPRSFFKATASECGMDITVLLHNVLKILACHAIDWVTNIHFGGNQNGGSHKENDSPDIVHSEVHIVNVDPPSVEHEDALERIQ